MITKGEVDLLMRPEMRRYVEQNLHADPLKVALNKTIPHASLVATQVKCLQRTRHKIPSFYAARCIIPSLAFEQSSGEKAASAIEWGGNIAVDLTCGLGVDAYFLARKFRKVVSIERDPVLAYLAEINMRLLGVENVTVVNSSAEDFVRDNADLRADLVYADPDRRVSPGRRSVRLEDCSPDILTLLPEMKKLGRRVAVKLSPLFDVDEAFRIFGHQTAVTVVSAERECKQVFVELSPDIPEPLIAARALGQGEVAYPLAEARGNLIADSSVEANHLDFRFLVVPDVALRKSRIARKYYTGKGLFMENDNSYAFAAYKPENIIGTIFEINGWRPWEPSAIKKDLKKRGLKRLNVYKLNFPLSTERVCRDLGISQGGVESMAFTTLAGKPCAISITVAE